ncbi:DUF6011 domain-containing protein [Streptomyces varsoviensis]|uniref:DUF6011 domain-containing protein n=1 Tax=Streptomyces varsoviensis TaxID=67373 RepID=UPI0033E4581C
MKTPRCRQCGRRLRDPASRTAGLGPVCRRALAVPKQPPPRGRRRPRQPPPIHPGADQLTLPSP